MISFFLSHSLKLVAFTLPVDGQFSPSGQPLIFIPFFAIALLFTLYVFFGGAQDKKAFSQGMRVFSAFFALVAAGEAWRAWARFFTLNNVTLGVTTGVGSTLFLLADYFAILRHSGPLSEVKIHSYAYQGLRVLLYWTAQALMIYGFTRSQFPGATVSA